PGRCVVRVLRDARVRHPRRGGGPRPAPRRHRPRAGLPPGGSDPVSTLPGFNELLEYLRRTRGFDLGGYKPSTVERRVSKRLGEVGMTGIVEYLDYLEVHPEEWAQLFNTILINVTGFFRDQESWDYVARELLPRILEARRPGDALRVWSAGCASGEEPYSLA